MGVIKRLMDPFGDEVEKDMIHILEPASSSDNESVEQESIPVKVKHALRPKPVIRNRENSFSDHINSRRPGQKQARRCNNLRELISMVEEEDLELDFNNFQPSFSAFTELFSEKEKMQAWNEFINSTEEEQMEFLNHENSNAPEPNDNDENNLKSEELETWEIITDKRSAHPCFSAEECFQRVDKNIRAMLKRRHRPMGLLVNLEENVVGFFHEWPTSVYVSKLSSSYERMMLHALCQYLDLISKSFDSDGRRHTQVENLHMTFNSPSVLLTQYLEQSSNS